MSQVSEINSPERAKLATAIAPAAMPYEKRKPAATRQAVTDPTLDIADAVGDLRGNLVQMIDGAGRTVMNAVMTGPAATSPNQLLDWTCTQYDQVYTLASYGTVSRTNQINQNGKWTSRLTDGFGWSVVLLDEDSNLPRNKHDSGQSLKPGLILTREIDIFRWQARMLAPLFAHRRIYSGGSMTGKLHSRQHLNSSVERLTWHQDGSRRDRNNGTPAWKAPTNTPALSETGNPPMRPRQTAS